MIFIAQINFVIALKDADSMLNDGIENKLGFVGMGLGGKFSWICDDDFIYVLVIHSLLSIGNMMKTDEIIYLFLHSVFQIPFFYFFCVCFCRIFFTLGLCIWGKNFFFHAPYKLQQWSCYILYVICCSISLCHLLSGMYVPIDIFSW